MSPSAIVTIIIPNYNHERYLKQRIESVLNQSYQNFELYILDDCSTDNSVNIIRKYENHPKVKSVIFNTSNSGSLFKQWVKGIELANGKYIWIAESDDFAHPDFLKQTVSELTYHSATGLVFTDSHIVDTKSNSLGLMSETHTLLNQFVSLGKKSLKSQDLSSYFINNLIISNASAVLFRAKALQELNMDRLQQFHNAGDLFSYISILLSHDIRYVHLPLNFYRTHEKNETKKNGRNGKLHQDRLNIITYFAPQIIKGDNLSEQMLAIFLKRHFLACSDFGLFRELSSLLAVYRKLDIIPLKMYHHLKMYCRIQVLFKRWIPYFYRAFIKRTLLSLVKN